MAISQVKIIKFIFLVLVLSLTVYLWWHYHENSPQVSGAQTSLESNQASENELDGYRNEQFKFAFEYPRIWKFEIVSILPQTTVALSDGSRLHITVNTYPDNFDWKEPAGVDVATEDVIIDKVIGKKSSWLGPGGERLITYHHLKRDDVFFTIEFSIKSDNDKDVQYFAKFFETLRLH